MAQFDGDAEMKRRHLALYLSRKQSLRVHKARLERLARDSRIGPWLRLMVQLTLLRPVTFAGNAAQRAFHHSTDVLTEAVDITLEGLQLAPSPWELQRLMHAGTQLSEDEVASLALDLSH